MAEIRAKKKNRVGGKRSSFLPTFVFRPLTPPYVPFGIRRFPLLGLTRDLHPLDNAHAERT